MAGEQDLWTADTYADESSTNYSNECRCGEHVSDAFARVFGTNKGKIPECPECAEALESIGEGIK